MRCHYTCGLSDIPALARIHTTDKLQPSVFAHFLLVAFSIWHIFSVFEVLTSSKTASLRKNCRLFFLIFALSTFSKKAHVRGGYIGDVSPIFSEQTLPAPPIAATGVGLQGKSQLISEIPAASLITLYGQRIAIAAIMSRAVKNFRFLS